MRNLLYALLFLVLLANGAAFAGWEDDFVKDADEFGIQTAVEEALSNDITPDEILTYIVSNSEQFEIKRGLKALYCAGADREEVREAADKLGITVEETSVALEEAIAECGSKVTLTDRDLTDDPEHGGGGSIHSESPPVN